MLLEFCRHDLCSGGNEVDYSHLRMVLPIANLVSYCEASWRKVLSSQDSYPDFTGGINHQNAIYCGGRSYAQSMRRVLSSEEIGFVVLGNLNISSSSGRLQLVDATGCVDFVLNIPETWNFKGIFEVRDFRLIMESTCPELVDLNSIIHQPLSCRSIFSNALPLKELKTLTYVYHCPSDEDSKSHSLFNGKGISQDFNGGKYHLLWLKHKFPIQKCLGNLAKRPNVFAEAIVVPWDLLVTGKYRDTISTTSSSDHFEECNKTFAGTKECLSHKRCRNNLTSVQVSSYSCNDTENGSRRHHNGFYSSHNSYTDKRCSDNPLESSCLNACGGANSHWMGMLHCTSKYGEVVSSCKPPRRSILLEFGPDCFLKYELLKIGCCYLVKHEDGDTLCCKEENYQVSHAKMFITSGTHFLSLTLSSIESLQRIDLSGSYDTWTKGSCKFEITCLIGNSTDSENYSDINLYVPSSALNFMKISDGIPDKSSGLMINASVQSSATSSADYPLPQGNLITLHGLVLAYHDCHGVDFLAQPGRCLGEGSKWMLLQENAGSCIHVFLDNHTVKIFCGRIKETWPIGLGRDACATFHRVLVLSEPDKYVMTAASFIAVDHASSMRGDFGHVLSDVSKTVGSHGVTSQDTVSVTLISDALKLSELRPMQFRCKVVSLYVLVLEKAGSNLMSQPCDQSIPSAFGIPFAGFIIDDGSSSCCCWADSERAAAFLGLDSEESSLEDTLGRCKKKPHVSTVGSLNQILERHSRISVKNYGFMFDFSCQDLEVTGNTNRSIRRSDEDFLQILIAKALISTSWTVDCTVMDKKTTTWLEQRVAELGFTLPPSLNVWATSIRQTDTLAEARNLIQELL